MRMSLMRWLIPVKGFRGPEIDNGGIIPRPSFLVRILHIIQPVNAVDCEGGFVAKSFGPMPIVTGNTNNLQPSPARQYLVQLSISLRLLIVVVSAYFQ